MPPKRKSLEDRNSAAIAKEAEVEIPAPKAVEPVAVTTATPTPAPANVTPSVTTSPETGDAAQARKGARKQRSAQDDRKQIGVYLSAETYRDMKAAYLADWTNRRGDAHTLYLWVDGALAAHAARSAAERAALPQEKRGTTQTGNTRAFKVNRDVYAQMQSAIADDEKAGRWSSESAWCVEAIRLATDAARAANGGTLPEPPERLPNSLKRRD